MFGMCLIKVLNIYYIICIVHCTYKYYFHVHVSMEKEVTQLTFFNHSNQ